MHVLSDGRIESRCFRERDDEVQNVMGHVNGHIQCRIFHMDAVFLERSGPANETRPAPKTCSKDAEYLKRYGCL